MVRVGYLDSIGATCSILQTKLNTDAKSRLLKFRLRCQSGPVIRTPSSHVMELSKDDNIAKSSRSSKVGSVKMIKYSGPLTPSIAIVFGKNCQRCALCSGPFMPILGSWSFVSRSVAQGFGLGSHT